MVHCSTLSLASGFWLGLANGQYCQEVSGHRNSFPWVPFGSLQTKCLLSWSPQIPPVLKLPSRVPLPLSTLHPFSQRQ